jgi:hypothetical protein
MFPERTSHSGALRGQKKYTFRGMVSGGILTYLYGVSRFAANAIEGPPAEGLDPI